MYISNLVTSKWLYGSSDGTFDSNLKNENMQGGGKYVQCDCKIRVRFR